MILKYNCNILTIAQIGGIFIKKEYEVVIELSKLNQKDKSKLINLLDDKSINWIEVLGYLCYHRLAGVAYEQVNSINIRKFDFPVFFSTYMIHQSQKQRTIIQKKYISEITEKLNKANIQYVFLKGSILSNTLYPIGARASNDIDILIEKKDLEKVTQILTDMELIQGKYDYRNNKIQKFEKLEIEQSIKTRGETSPFLKIINEPTAKTIDVDVNFSLDWTPNINEDTIKYFLSQRTLLKIDNDISIYSLRLEHMFIQLCIHLYKDSALLDIVKKRKVLDLYKFIDLYLFVQTYFENIDIELIYNDAKKFGFDKYIYFALIYVKEIFKDIDNIRNVKNLLRKLDYIDENIMNIIYDQYDYNINIELKDNLIERIFTYNIINNNGGKNE